MKANTVMYWVRVVLLCLLWLVSLVATPLLVNEASYFMGDPIKAENYDNEPNPVPMPPSPVASPHPIAAAATVSPLVNVPQSVPVPTPPLAQSPALPNEQHQMESASLVKIPMGAPQAMIVIALSFILIASLLRRRFAVHSVHQGCAS